MNERTKDFTLLALILTSFVLTARVLFGQPTLETAKPPAYEQLTFGELKPPAEQVLPELRLRLEENTWRLLLPWNSQYQEAWGPVLHLLLAAGPAEKAGAPPLEEEGLLLDARFPAPVPPAAYGAQRMENQEMDRLVWHAADPEHLWLREAGGSWWKSRLWSQPGSVEALAGKMSGLPAYVDCREQSFRLPVSEDLLLPLVSPRMAPRLAAKEQLPLEKLVRSIFVDTALVRLIEERDGARIYTDGQKGLRVFDYGEVEFTSPHSEPGSQAIKPANALRRTAQFLQLLGGWTETLYIDSLRREESPAYLRRQWDSYTVRFLSAQHGYPVLAPRPPVSLRFTDRGVIYYNRQLRLLGEETEYARPLMDPTEVLSVAARLWPEEGKKPELQALTPVYYLRDPATYPAVATPAWALRFDDGRTAVLHGFTGTFLAWL